MREPRHNEHCPCGSGRKYKHCCALKGRSDSSPNATTNTHSGFHAQTVLSRLENAVATSPHDLNANLALAQHLQRPIPDLNDERRVSRLIEVLRQGFKLAPQHHDLGLYLANLLIDQRDFLGAIDVLRILLVATPRSVQCLNELSVAYQGICDWTQAIDSSNKALAIEPHSIEAMGNLALALEASEKYSEALSQFEKISQLDSDHALAIYGAARCAVKCQNFQKGVQFYKRLTSVQTLNSEQAAEYIWALWLIGEFKQVTTQGAAHLVNNPQDYLSAHNIGNSFLMMSEPVEALKCFSQGLAALPNYVPLLVSQAMALKVLGQIDDAMSIVKQALAIFPSDPAARVLHGSLLCDFGKFDEAENLFNRVIADDPSCTDALVGVTRCRKMKSSDHHWLQNALQSLAKEPNPAHKANLLHAVGKYYDDCKDHQNSFLNHQHANEIIYRYGLGYRPEEVELNFHAVIQRFSEAHIRELKGTSCDSVQPIFIVGMPRSGTTLVEQIVSSNDAVFAGGEMVYWNFAQDVFLKKPQTAGRGLIQEFSSGYLTHIATRTAQLRATDKLPANFANLGLIHCAFPNAKIVHINRHPYDIALSIYFQGFAVAHRYAHRLRDIAHYYLCYTHFMDHWKAVLPAESLFTISYESLVTDPIVTSQKLFNFLNLDWNPSVLETTYNVQPVLTASGWQVRQPIHAHSIRRSKAYDSWLDPEISDIIKFK